MVNCDECHEEEGEAYMNSVHKKAGGKGITIPCYACHGYHYVTHLEADSVFERENAFCLKCHNPDNFHDWLPQKDTHFAFVECAVCHAPDSPRYIALRFYDLISNKFFSDKELLDALGTDYDGFMDLVDRNKDDIISVDEVENIVFLLRQKDIRGTFHGELVVEMVPSVHHVNRGGANRECEQCHNPESPFFEEVYMCLNKDDGTREHYKVERNVLESYYVNHFYALGGTRVRLLDRIGLALIIGGICVVLGHLSVRVVTAPARRRKKKKKDEFAAY
jgi:predicted CXXCH cytochrome family protein